MKVLLCHNYYQQRGGEDQCFEDETALLKSHGHKVLHYTRHNDDIDTMGSVSLACQSLWSRRTYRELRELFAREHPDVMHITNPFPLVSPSAYYAARKEGVPVVQALHNYRALCPKAQFYRDEQVCEDCLGRAIPWPAVRHKCYRRNRKATVVVSALVAWQRLSRMWRLVNRFYTLSEFARRKFVEGGLPEDRIDIKPNFVLPDPGFVSGSGDCAVFVGRLSEEKGLKTLVEAWSRVKSPLPLRIVGDGPLADFVRRAAEADSRIEWLGKQPLEEVCRIVGGASCLVMPSIWYETFGRTIIEAFSVGTPVVVSRLGAMAELVDDGKTGCLFNPGDAEDLVSKVVQLTSDADRLKAMGRAARTEFETKYTAEANYDLLCDIYERAAGRQLVERDRG